MRCDFILIVRYMILLMWKLNKLGREFILYESVYINFWIYSMVYVYVSGFVVVNMEFNFVNLLIINIR